MDYDTEVEDEAVDFIYEHEDMILEALKNDADWDYNDIENLDQCWHESIVDRGYTLEDAAYVLDNCHEEESDYGIWEGLDARDAMSARAAYSYANDVWFKCEELYGNIKERYDELIYDGKNEDAAAQQAFDEFKSEEEIIIVPVEKGSKEELRLIREWLRRNEQDAGMRGGYPVGGSYIDARCGVGYGMPDVKDYVDFDHEFAKRVPWLSGKYKDVVQKRHDELVGEKRNLKKQDYSKLNDLTAKQFVDKIHNVIIDDERLSINDIREISRNLEQISW